MTTTVTQFPSSRKGSYQGTILTKHGSITVVRTAVRPGKPGHRSNATVYTRTNSR